MTGVRLRPRPAEPLPERNWFGVPVKVFDRTPDEVGQHIPDFERRPLLPTGFSERMPRPNPRYDLIVRLSYQDDRAEVAIGTVSSRYSLVPHRDVVNLALGALDEAGVDPRGLEAELEITEFGERMAYHLYLPAEYDFDPGDGHAMGLRLSCFNSVEGSMRFTVVLGWLRFVCANGLIVGATKLHFRQTHHHTLDLERLAAMVAKGINDARDERERYAEWVRKVLTLERLATWIDGPVQQAWGVHAAARAWNILRTGHDAKLLVPFEKRPASQRRLQASKWVPGSRVPGTNAYAASQALAWLARDRRELSEQMKMLNQVPTLMSELLEPAA